MIADTIANRGASSVMNSSFEAQGLELRRNWWLPGIGVAMVVLGFVASRLSEGLPGLLGSLGIWLGSFLAPVSLLRNAFPLSRRTTVSVTNHVLHVGGRAPIPAETITEAKMVPRPGPSGDTVVELVMRDRSTLSLWITKSEARQLLRVLGTAPGERRTGFRLMSSFGFRMLLALVFVALPLLLVAGTISLVAGLLFSILAALVLGFVPGRILVGAEGFTIRWPLYERFTHYRDVESVTAKDRLGATGVIDSLVTLENGRKLRLRTPEAPDTDAQRGTESRALHQHLAEAHQRWRENSRDRVEVQALLASGSDGRDWLSNIDAVMNGGALRYRVAAVDENALEAIARDPNGDARARVGASAALLRSRDPRHRARVRIAAEACAEPSLRTVLLALSEAEDDREFEAALDKAVAQKRSLTT